MKISMLSGIKTIGVYTRSSYAYTCTRIYVKMSDSGVYWCLCTTHRTSVVGTAAFTCSPHVRRERMFFKVRAARRLHAGME